MNFKKNILYFKKFILFLFMMLSYAVSYSAPFSNSSEIKKETEKTFIIKTEPHNPVEYYIAAGKTDTAVHFYENKSELLIIPQKIKDFFVEEEYAEYIKPYAESLLSDLYDIATDITRSMRN